ncbi:J domain-containing protein [Mucilaginibacter paludis]|uniref:Heat shock protein DnaJ domain protein n=1 Tax=Mucilaginibacter paludis DSM 18603 TaxID=714943 RepID=H1Y8L9_9SPHI|nr:J domain-containing protein [Mucilaginibacter paludis]EHQ26891.1 heat shock protein DnaJ domain protein [Mucilaginibacter paludis DSM 18603]
MSEQNHYIVLEIDKSADQDTIKRAFRKLSILYHPDKTGNDPVLTEKFIAVKLAYEVLSNPEKRKRYNDILEGRAQPDQRTTFSSPTEPPIVTRIIKIFDNLEF